MQITQKNAITVTVATLVMGIFGAFLRWLQNRNIFEEETGLPIPGSAISAAVLIFTLAMFAVMLGIVWIYLRNWTLSRDAAEALRANTVFPLVLAWMSAAVFMLCGLKLMFSAGETALSTMQRMFGAAVIVAGVCFPTLPIRGNSEELFPVSRRITSSFLTLCFCFWLIFSYRSNAQAPSLWRYAPEIVAIAASAVAFYYLTGSYYGKGKPRTTLVSVFLAIYLDISVLPDERRTVLSAMLGVTAVMLLMLEYLMLCSMTERAPAGKKK